MELMIKDGQEVKTIDSREVAEMMEKRHADLMRDIRTYIGHLTTNADLHPLNFFVESEYVDNKGETRGCYLLTKKGCEFVANKMTGAKGTIFTAKYIERFNEMESGINQLAGMSKELQAIIMMDKKQVEIDKRLVVLEGNMTIDYGQQELLSRIARERLVMILGGKASKAYKELNKKVFSELWNKYKQAFSVNSYRNTASKDFEIAKTFITDWEPCKETKYMIAGANAQMKFE